DLGLLRRAELLQRLDLLLLLGAELLVGGVTLGVLPCPRGDQLLDLVFFAGPRGLELLHVRGAGVDLLLRGGLLLRRRGELRRQQGRRLLRQRGDRRRDAAEELLQLAGLRLHPVDQAVHDGFAVRDEEYLVLLDRALVV